MLSCDIFVQVKKEDGSSVDSNLFKDILGCCSTRTEALDVYSRVSNEKFINDNKELLIFDENGEPILGSLLQIVNFEDKLPQIEEVLLAELPKTEVIDNLENYNNLVEKVIKFNNESRFRGAYTALIAHSEKNGKKVLYPIIVQSSNESITSAENYEKQYTLNAFIRKRLANAGVSIGVYDNLVEEIQANGVTDFDAIKKASNGLCEIIRVADNSLGEAVLPEEFSHFLLGCLENNKIVVRLKNLLENKDLVKEILGDEYERYSKIYNYSEDKLAYEALAHLLSKYLLENIISNNNSANSLLERLVPSFRNLFSNLDAAEIEAKIKEIDSGLKELSNYALNEREELNYQNIQLEGQWYNLGKKIKSLDEILQNIVDTELKRQAMYGHGDSARQFREEQRILVDELSLLRNSDDLKIIGISKFVLKAHEITASLLKRFSKISSSNQTIKEKADTLRNIKNYVDSYLGELQDIEDIILEERLNGITKLNVIPEGSAKDLESLIGETILQLKSIENQFLNVATTEVLIPFFKPFFGEELRNPFTKETLKIEDFIGTAQRDTGFLNTWLSSMSRSTDWMNKLLATAVKEARTKIRFESIDYEKRIQAAGLKLTNAGITDFDFIFERDDQGNKTLRFIDRVNYGQYYKDKKEFEESQNRRFGDDRNSWTSAQYEEYKANKANWHKEHSIWVDPDFTDNGIGYFRPNDKDTPGTKNYTNKQYERIAADPKKLEFLNTMKAIKAELDRKTNNSAKQKYIVPIVLKDSLERLADAKTPKALGLTMLESLKDEILRRSDDTEFGTNIRTNFKNEEIERLPLYYQTLRSTDNPNDVTSDIISSMSAYAYMACNFSGMKDIVDCLEISRYVADEVGAKKVDSKGIPIISTVKAFAREAENEVIVKNTNVKKQRDSWFSAQVYGRFYKDLGSFELFGKEIDWNKLADLSNKITAIAGLGFNAPAALVNVEQGRIMMDIEKTAKQFFEAKDVRAADVLYAKLLTDFLPQVGNRINTSKLALWIDKLNVMQEYDRKVKDIGFDRETWFKKMFGTDFVFLLSNAGEHWMQNRTFLALANSDKEQLLDGDKKISLIDAYLVKFISKDGSLTSTDQGLGAKLVLKKGLKTQDGKRIITEEEKSDIQNNGTKEQRLELIKNLRSGEWIDEYKVVNAFSRKASEINHRLHGVYNNEDMSAFQQHAIGRLCMIFRKWLVPSIERRYAKQNYNFDMQDWTEGYYRTLGRLIKDVRRNRLHVAEEWSNLSDQEKQNVRRAGRELATFALILGSLAFIRWKDGDDDDDDDTWLESALKWNLYRLRTELGAILPTPYLFSESLKILKMPTADINLWDNTINTLGLLNPWNYSWNDDAIIKNGKFKGKSQAYKLIATHYILDPFYNDIRNLLHPEEMIPFYKQ